MAAHALFKNQLMDDEKYHNLMTWLIFRRRSIPENLVQLDFLNEPSHEIVVLFVLRKLILQSCMRSHPVRQGIWFSCVRTATALAIPRGWAGSPEPSLVAYVISTIIPWDGSNGFSLLKIWYRSKHFIFIYLYKCITVFSSEVYFCSIKYPFPDVFICESTRVEILKVQPSITLTSPCNLDTSPIRHKCLLIYFRFYLA